MIPCHKNRKERTGELTQWVRALAAFVEGQVWFPAPARWLPPSVTSGHLIASSDFSSTRHAHPCRQKGWRATEEDARYHCLTSNIQLHVHAHIWTHKETRTSRHTQRRMPSVDKSVRGTEMGMSVGSAKSCGGHWAAVTEFMNSCLFDPAMPPQDYFTAHWTGTKWQIYNVHYHHPT